MSIGSVVLVVETQLVLFLELERLHQVVGKALVGLEGRGGLAVLDERLDVPAKQSKHGAQHAVKLLQSVVLVRRRPSAVSLLGDVEDVGLEVVSLYGASLAGCPSCDLRVVELGDVAVLAVQQLHEGTSSVERIFAAVVHTSRLEVFVKSKLLLDRVECAAPLAVFATKKAGVALHVLLLAAAPELGPLLLREHLKVLGLLGLQLLGVLRSVVAVVEGRLVARHRLQRLQIELQFVDLLGHEVGLACLQRKGRSVREVRLARTLALSRCRWVERERRWLNGGSHGRKFMNGLRGRVEHLLCSFLLERAEEVGGLCRLLEGSKAVPERAVLLGS